jgi:hypothetical protein
MLRVPLGAEAGSINVMVQHALAQPLPQRIPGSQRPQDLAEMLGEKDEMLKRNQLLGQRFCKTLGLNIAFLNCDPLKTFVVKR